MQPIKIDGSYGEGGGQIVRSAITLSCLTQKPVEIENIRKNRKIPGLRPQHFSGIKLAAKVCNAKVEGLQVGSTHIKFFPSKFEEIELQEDVGTAGSISLIIQILIPLVSISKKKLKISLKGGTDVSWSPSYDYTKIILKEAYSRIGINFDISLKKRGYYPKGGGEINAQIFPCGTLNPIHLIGESGKSVKILSSYSKLPKNQIDKEINQAKKLLLKAGYDCQEESVGEDAFDKGFCLLIYSIKNDSIIGSDVIGRTGINDAGNIATLQFLQSTLGVDKYLSDMLAIPLCFVNDASTFRVNQISKHLETNLFVATKILNSRYGIGRIDGGYEVRIAGGSNPSV